VKPEPGKSSVVAATLWVVAYLGVADIAVNLLFPYPRDPRNITPSAIQQYFEYGRSTEGKFDRMVGRTEETSAPIVSSGWLESTKDPVRSKQTGTTGRPVVTMYGMSHATRLADAMALLDTADLIRSFGAPGAVPTWSFTAFEFDRAAVHSDVVILGVMTDGIPLISTTTGATMMYDLGYPYTYPRYFLEGDTLRHVSPPFVSVDGFREYFFEREKWDRYVQWLSQYDGFYDPLLFRKSILDQSSIIRLLRRGYANGTRRKMEMQVYNDGQFNAESDEVRILERLVSEFAKDARHDGSIPILYIVNNYGTGTSLFRLLEPTLTKNNIRYLSSHTICPPDDATCYLSDSHFVPAKNLELAKVMVRVVHEALRSARP